MESCNNQNRILYPSKDEKVVLFKVKCVLFVAGLLVASKYPRWVLLVKLGWFMKCICLVDLNILKISYHIL